MTDVVLIDTDILVDAGVGDEYAVGCLTEIERHSALALSIVCKMELIVDRFLPQIKLLSYPRPFGA